MLEELEELPRKLEIDTAHLGFYKPPIFRECERNDPNFLRSCGLYVTYREYSPDYLEYVRKDVPQVNFMWASIF